jgi:NAD(P)H-dependent FMN reductase
VKLLTFAATNSKHSINQSLAVFAAGLVDGAEVEILDINDYEMPIFSIEREQELGQPDAARAFFRKIGEADALIISFAEHNGTYTAAYKNLFDWTSRIDTGVFQNKPTVFLATSPGGRGAAGVLATASNSGPHFAANLKASVSVPSFHENFDSETNTLKNSAIEQQLRDAVALL